MKAQAAVEYLMTYGWAILALLIVIAVLMSTGIFSPQYLVSEECNFGNNLKCSFSMFNEGGSTKVLLTVFNGFPYKVRITDIHLENMDRTQQFVFTSTEAMLDSGGNTTFMATLGGPALPEGQVRRLVGNITYTSCATELGPVCSDVEHIASGRITARVIPS